MDDPNKLEELREQVRKRLGESGVVDNDITSENYKTFVKEEEDEGLLKGFFSRYCDFSGNILSFFRNQKVDSLDEAIEIAGLKISSGSVIAATVLTVLLGFLSMLPFVVIGSMGYTFFTLMTFLFLAYVIYTYPEYSAEVTKIKAQQESVLAMLYMTIYMRVNPVLENALLFASTHLHGPLGKDLKRILWLLNMEKVDSIEEAIEHINTHSSHHSESILTNDYAHSQQFLEEVDSAAVYVNASTRFTDGGEFGLGAEIGISTNKLHSRGPMGLEDLTTQKFIIWGNGQIR